MEPWMFRFKAEGTVDYSQLTFDPGQNELIVGARNHLFRLNLEDLTLIQVSANSLILPQSDSPTLSSEYELTVCSYSQQAMSYSRSVTPARTT
ncbi:hypothetical protein PBY51_014498 [Eleginops maclovinus]|uniref:Sema domain-containing protein n=1 Tax=Eleginops maclovinus TaxID=56733 RepID=A0AAN7WVU9_ELEMC|nr:hypothetical protein PBY51_014498 [Eleginops maclovinus]